MNARGLAAFGGGEEGVQGAMLFTPKNNPANLCGGELHTVDDDTCDGMGHTVGRPVMRMGGGTLNPMERLCQLPSDLPFK